MIPNVTTELISNADITVLSSLSRIVREDNNVQLNITITEYHFHRELTPRARDFPNPHDGEMKSEPAEKLYETPTKTTMGLMK